MATRRGPAGHGHFGGSAGTMTVAGLPWVGRILGLAESRGDDGPVENGPIEKNDSPGDNMVERMPGPTLVTVAGRNIRFDVAGSGPPALLLHGINRSLEDWALVRDELARRHTVYRVDLPGFGGSERVPRIDLETLAASMLGFLDAIGETRPVRLIGNSLGGAVALQMTALQPERVAALVLVDSAGFGREVGAILRVLAVPGMGRRLLTPSLASAERETRSIFFDQSLVTPERVRFALELARQPGRADVLLDTLAALGSWRGIRPEWRAKLLREVRDLDVPMLVMWGAEDAVLPVRHFAGAKLALPRARFHLFERTGHMPQLERPDEFVELVEGFLAEVAV